MAPPVEDDPASNRATVPSLLHREHRPSNTSLPVEAMPDGQGVRPADYPHLKLVRKMASGCRVVASDDPPSLASVTELRFIAQHHWFGQGNTKLLGLALTPS